MYFQHDEIMVSIRALADSLTQPKVARRLWGRELRGGICHSTGMPPPLTMAETSGTTKQLNQNQEQTP
jgi:hypothetical protein